MKAFRTVFAVVSAAALMFFTGCGDSDNNDDTPAPEILNLAGVWTVTITYTADSDVEMWTYNLTQTGSTLSGTSYESNRPKDTATMSGTVNGTAVTLTEDWGPDGIVPVIRARDPNDVQSEPLP